MKMPNRGAITLGIALAVLAGAVGWTAWNSAGDSEGSAELQDGNAPPTIQELQAAADADPENPESWQRLGLALFAENRFAEAATAYERATQADPESAVLWSALGETLTYSLYESEGDPLPARAIAAFERALALDSGEPRARYFLAIRKDLAGDHEGAIADWLALLADTPPGATWETNLVDTIRQVGQMNEIEVEGRITSASAARNMLPAEALAGPAAQGRGPTAEQLAAASSIPPSQQQEMAEGMVARLAARLEGEPDDVDGWIMLMRSYKQLGRDGDARRARDSALAANPGARAAINDAAQSLGIR